MNGNGNRPVECPANPVWIEKMLAILPPGLRGKLEPYEGCLAQAEAEKVKRVVHPRVKDKV